MSAPRLRRSILSLGLLGVLGLASGPSTAQEPQPPKETPPAPQAPREVRLPQVHEKTLANGLRVVVLENHEQPTVSLRVVVPAGRIHDQPAKAGLAEAAALLLTKGTASRSAQQIAEAIDSVGGTLYSQSGPDYTFAWSQVTTDQVDLGLELLADVVLRPSFPEEEIERWRQQSLSGLQVQRQNPEYLAAAVFSRAVYGEHPYGLPVEGTTESVSALKRDDFASFHKRHFLPNESIFAVVGDVKPAEAFAKVERYFGAWKKGEAVKPPTVKAAAGNRRRILVVDKPDAVQTQIVVGQLGLAYTDPDFFDAQVYSAILGSGVSSRLYKEIRRDRGLSYGAYSAFQTPAQQGSFLAGTSTKTESTLQALDLILANLDRLAKEPVPATELEGRKTYLSGSFVRQTEVPDSIATLLIQAMTNGYGKDFIESYRGKLEGVTSADIQSFARERIHPDRILIVLVGNASGFAADLEKKLGPFETIPYAEVDLLQDGLRKNAADNKPAAR